MITSGESIEHVVYSVNWRHFLGAKGTSVGPGETDPCQGGSLTASLPRPAGERAEQQAVGNTTSHFPVWTLILTLW